MQIQKGDITTSLTTQWGGKSNGLLNLVRLNYLTPDFYILSQPINEQLSELYPLKQLIEKWQRDFKIDKDQLWAVRSSAALEDGLDKSFAGQYLTELNVSFEGLEQAIKNVINSYSEVDTYKDAVTDFSILIQEMIPAEYSGVIFSKHPQNLLSTDSILQIIPGLGDTLVSGELDGLTIEGDVNHYEYNEIYWCYTL